MKTFALSALLMAPVAALADCPTAEDLDTGILFHVEGGDTELFRRDSAETVRSVYRYADGSGETHLLLGRGMYVLGFAEVADGQPASETLIAYDFGVPPAEMPLPRPEAGWTAEVTVTDAQGQDEELQIYSFGERKEVRFGACRYEMIPVIQSYRPDPFELVEYVNWLPELGISYLVRASDRDGEDRYVYTDIEAVR